MRFRYLYIVSGRKHPEIMNGFGHDDMKLKEYCKKL